MIGRMASIHDVVFDCEYPASVARFWASVLDGYAVAPYDEQELERLLDFNPKRVVFAHDAAV